MADPRDEAMVAHAVACEAVRRAGRGVVALERDEDARVLWRVTVWAHPSRGYLGWTRWHDDCADGVPARAMGTVAWTVEAIVAWLEGA